VLVVIHVAAITMAQKRPLPVVMMMMTLIVVVLIFVYSSSSSSKYFCRCCSLSPGINKTNNYNNERLLLGNCVGLDRERVRERESIADSHIVRIWDEGAGNTTVEREGIESMTRPISEKERAWRSVKFLSSSGIHGKIVHLLTSKGSRSLGHDTLTHSVWRWTMMG
jgi:hypothetical protein